MKDNGIKLDGEKTRLDLLPVNALESVGKVLTRGAKKYAPNNWRKVPGWRWRYIGAAIRHIFAYLRGENFDLEWGLPHLAHAACCVLFVLELDLTNAPNPDAEVERRLNERRRTAR